MWRPLLVGSRRMVVVVRGEEATAGGTGDGTVRHCSRSHRRIIKLRSGGMWRGRRLWRRVKRRRWRRWWLVVAQLVQVKKSWTTVCRTRTIRCPRVWNYSRGQAVNMEHKQTEWDQCSWRNISIFNLLISNQIFLISNLIKKLNIDLSFHFHL